MSHSDCLSLGLNHMAASAHELVNLADGHDACRLLQSVEVSRAPANWQPPNVHRQQPQQQPGAAPPPRPQQQSQGGSNMQWPRVLPPSQAPPGMQPGSRKVALVYDDGTIEVLPAFDAGPRHSGGAAPQTPAVQRQQRQPVATQSAAAGSAAAGTAVSNQDSIPLPDAPSASAAAEPAASEGSDASESGPQATADAAASDGTAAIAGPHTRGAGNVSSATTCPVGAPAARAAAGGGPSGAQQQEAPTQPELGGAAAAGSALRLPSTPARLQQPAQSAARTGPTQQTMQPAGAPSQLPATPQQQSQPPASSAPGGSMPVAWADTPSQQSQQMRAPPGLAPNPPASTGEQGFTGFLEVLCVGHTSLLYRRSAPITWRHGHRFWAARSLLMLITCSAEAMCIKEEARLQCCSCEGDMKPGERVCRVTGPDLLWQHDTAAWRRTGRVHVRGQPGAVGAVGKTWRRRHALLPLRHPIPVSTPLAAGVSTFDAFQLCSLARI